MSAATRPIDVRCELCAEKHAPFALKKCETPDCSTIRACTESCIAQHPDTGLWFCAVCEDNAEAKAPHPWYRCVCCNNQIAGSFHDNGGLCLYCNYAAGDPDSLPDVIGL